MQILYHVGIAVYIGCANACLRVHVYRDGGEHFISRRKAGSWPATDGEPGSYTLLHHSCLSPHSLLKHVPKSGSEAVDKIFRTSKRIHDMLIPDQQGMLLPAATK